ncbi:MAG: DUF2442 domain-containing protein [Spirochaetota bacterium]
MLHQVIQVIPKEDYTVYVYFIDGIIKQYDVSHLVGKGVFAPLSDLGWYMDRCTVLNGTLAWDRSGRYDPREALDVDPEVIYNHGKTVSDPLEAPA